MRRIWQLIAVGCALVAGFWVTSAQVDGQRSAEINHVIHISVDGINATMLRDLLASESANYDTFRRLVAEGASTWNARTDYAYTVTMPNHVSMLTGLPVLRPSGADLADYHGYVVNTDVDDESDTIHTANIYRDYTPSVFDVLEANGMTGALYASKTKFNLFERSYGDKLDSFVIDYAFLTKHNAKPMHEQLLEDLATQHFNYTFVHYRGPDTMGHLFDWGSLEYNNALAYVDGLLGELMAQIEADSVMAGKTALIVTTDHGGGVPSRTHSQHDSAENYTIPIFIWGPGVAAGADLYALNQGNFTDPELARPAYATTNQPLRSGYTGNWALQLLGLPPIDGSYMATAINLTEQPPLVVQVTAEPTAEIFPTEMPTATPVPALRPNDNCRAYISTDVPIEIDGDFAQSGLLVEDVGVVDGVSVSAEISHSWVGDLTISLIHGESGRQVVLLDRPGVPASSFGCFRDDVLATFGDGAADGVGSAELVCNKRRPTIMGSFTPSQPLSTLRNQPTEGVWVLQVEDAHPAGDSGTIERWQLNICTQQ